MAIRIVDVTDDPTFALLPPCADPGFDHRSCDYWEDADRGSKAARASWFGPQAAPEPAKPSRPRNPFGGDDDDEPAFNPFAPARRETYNPFLAADDEAPENPFAPKPKTGPVVAADAPPKLRLLARGLAVFGSYAKVLLEDDEPAAYAQFGPLSAYPRALLVLLYPVGLGGHIEEGNALFAGPRRGVSFSRKAATSLRKASSSGVNAKSKSAPYR